MTNDQNDPLPAPRERLLEFPGAIRELRLHNAIVRSVTDAYAYGAILTREEALCRMVVELAKNWGEESRRALEEATCLLTMVKKERSDEH